MFIAIKTEDGSIKGKISFYGKVLGITRQGFHNYLKTKDLPWKYQSLADAMLDICAEDECNDTYGRIRMHQALQVKQPEGVPIPSERTVYHSRCFAYTTFLHGDGDYLCVQVSFPPFNFGHEKRELAL